MPAVSIRSSVAVGSAGRPACSRAASAKAAKTSAGLYSSTSSAAALDDLRLGAPLAGHLVLVARAGAERAVRRDGQVVGVVVDQHQAADLLDARLLASRKRLQLIAGVGPGRWSARGSRQTAISPRAPDMLSMLDRPPCPWASSSVRSRSSSDAHGWYSKSVPIRSRRNIAWWRSNIHSPARWPMARERSSASSLSIVP